MSIEKIFETITNLDAPHLHDALNELCKKAGVEKPVICKPSIGALLHPSSGVMLDHLVGVMNIDKPRLIIGEKAMKIFGQKDLNAPVEEMFKAVIAHEIGHLKHNDIKLNKVIPTRLTPLIGLAAAVGGLALYEHLHKKEAVQNIQLPSDRKTSLNNEIEAVKKDGIGDAATSIIKYTAAAALGLLAGSVACKMMHNHIEFRADKFSASLMGTGKPLSDALEAFSKYADKMQESMGKPGLIGTYLKWIMHPDINERINRLRSI